MYVLYSQLEVRKSLHKGILLSRKHFPFISIIYLTDWPTFSAKNQPYALGYIYLAPKFLKTYSPISTIFECEMKYLKSTICVKFYPDELSSFDIVFFTL